MSGMLPAGIGDVVADVGFMEFFAEVAHQVMGVDELARRLTITSLPDVCASIDTVLSQSDDAHGEIYCLWGQFSVSRQRVKNGVRFALLDCPHALAWTITLQDQGRSIVVHCTIDKREEAQEFVESIEQFVADWADGLREIQCLVETTTNESDGIRGDG